MANIDDLDVPTVVFALRGHAAERKAFNETLGANYPDDVKRRTVAHANECERIANDLEKEV